MKPIQRRRFIQALAGAVLACKMALPLGSIDLQSSDSFTTEMLRAAVARLHWQNIESTEPIVVWVHPAHYDKYAEEFGLPKRETLPEY